MCMWSFSLFIFVSCFGLLLCSFNDMRNVLSISVRVFLFRPQMFHFTQTYFGLPLECLVVDCTVDSAGRAWLLQVKSFTVRGASPKDWCEPLRLQKFSGNWIHLYIGEPDKCLRVILTIRYNTPTFCSYYIEHFVYLVFWNLYINLPLYFNLNIIYSIIYDIFSFYQYL